MRKKRSVLFNRWLVITSIIFLGSCTTYQGVGYTREASKSQKNSQQKAWSQFNSVK